MHFLDMWTINFYNLFLTFVWYYAFLHHHNHVNVFSWKSLYIIIITQQKMIVNNYKYFVNCGKKRENVAMALILITLGT